MPTQPYYNAKGERISGNTTIINANLGWSKDALMGWQKNIFKAQMCQSCLEKLIEPNEYRDKAADAGTLGHAMIEADIKGLKIPEYVVSPTTQEIFNKALKAYQNFLEWKSQVNFKLLTMEVPCVSEAYQFGTTVDIIAEVVGRRTIVEVKTSKSIHEDYLIQVAAQKIAWDETHPGQEIEGLHLLKLGTEDAMFDHLWRGPDVLNEAFEAFKDLRSLHDKRKVLKRLI